MAWVNQSKNSGGTDIVWNDANFTWDQSEPMTWDNNYQPFINQAKGTGSWTNAPKGSATFTNQPKGT